MIESFLFGLPNFVHYLSFCNALGFFPQSFNTLLFSPAFEGCQCQRLVARDRSFVNLLRLPLYCKNVTNYCCPSFICVSERDFCRLSEMTEYRDYTSLLLLWWNSVHWEHSEIPTPERNNAGSRVWWIRDRSSDSTVHPFFLRLLNG